MIGLALGLPVALMGMAVSLGVLEAWLDRHNH